MRTTSVGVFKVATKGPGDVSGLMSMITSGAIDPASILAILGKTEGNGGVNDFTREYAVAALCAALAPQLGLSPQEVEQRIAFVMSGGTEGVLSPHITVFTRRDVQQRPAGISGKRLSIGMAHTRDFLPEELGRSAQITETANAVHSAATAYSRVKSLTPPLPSVLPRIARTDVGSIVPEPIISMRPETSPGPLVATLKTPTDVMRMTGP